ncbi:heat shock protein Hsp20 [Methylobacterium sp. 4-46]|uniref:Hsp20/alpha crystallin family protein n=1 Tax=unclassified Methylobacterium TaxID=2615210 RepID=UPI000152CCA6|nr:MULTISPECIES: Hsp20/alpha crystallin family protein [Methylobacterium]ACA20380.1 heat shock protein Hsp20 [Methylobacterium sp. 4-46]WFT79548.1 Hsp20/alpha crystallin family protein [Methylobacterium nodulans]
MNLKSILALGGRHDDPLVGLTAVQPPLQREFDRMLGEVRAGLPAFLQGPMPRMDVVERDDHVEVTAELPGLERSDVQLELIDDMLVIRGEKRQEREGMKGTRRVTERSYGAFSRAIELPAGTQPEEIEARMEKGVLTLRLPKPHAGAPRARTIDIKAG